MYWKMCSKCAHKINRTFVKCPYCGIDQRNWYQRNKSFVKFIIGLIFVIILFNVLIGPKLANRNSSPGGSSGSAGIINIDQETKTDEFIIKVNSVDIVKPSVDQVRKLQLQEEELLVVVEWQFEPIPNVKLSSSPSVSLDYYPVRNSVGEKKTEKIRIDEVTSTSSKTSGDELVRKTTTFKIKKDEVDSKQWQLSIEADWHLTIKDNK